MMEAAGPSKRIEDDAGSAQGEENADLSCQDDAVSTHQDVDSAHQEDEVDSAHQECDIDSTHQEDDADSAHQEDDDTDSWISVHSDDEEWNESGMIENLYLILFINIYIIYSCFIQMMLVTYLQMMPTIHLIAPGVKKKREPV